MPMVIRSMMDQNGQNLLKKIFQNTLDKFLVQSDISSQGRGMLRFVSKELLAYKNCGDLRHGFTIVRCLGSNKQEVCKKDTLVPFSCKNRGFCPSCSSRRMHSRSIHLEENVIPPVPMRQWVVTLPFKLRFWLRRTMSCLKKSAEFAKEKYQSTYGASQSLDLQGIEIADLSTLSSALQVIWRLIITFIFWSQKASMFGMENPIKCRSSCELQSHQIKT